MHRKRTCFAVTRACLRLAFVAMAILMMRSTCLPQVAGGTITGAVKDSSGAVVGNAQVTIKNSETDISRTVEVNDDGIYSAPNLVPGTYEITVVSPGVGTVVRSGITLTVGAEQVVDIQLSPGSVQTKIEVSGAPPNIELATSSLDATMNSTTVRELPLNGEIGRYWPRCSRE